jgi:hypothetical protein
VTKRKCGHDVPPGVLCSICRGKQIAAERRVTNKANRVKADIDDAVARLPVGHQTVVRRWYGYHPELAYSAALPTVRSRCANYGISVGRWLYLVAIQESKCAICRTDNYPEKLSIDHDHHTGFVRGLLCPPCNIGLGNLRIDGVGSVDRAEAVLAYVRAHRSVTKLTQNQGVSV